MSWEQLISINEQNAQEVRSFTDAPPVACPNDGEPLSTGPDGQLFCPCGDWREGYSRIPVNAAAN